jgi:hypothetical protein
VDALATARLTRLLTQDSITEPFRVRVERAEGAGHLPLGAGEFVSCPWCVGVWVSAAVATARRVAPRAWNVAAGVLACAEVAGLLAARPPMQLPPWAWPDDTPPSFGFRVVQTDPVGAHEVVV